MSRYFKPPQPLSEEEMLERATEGLSPQESSFYKFLHRDLTEEDVERKSKPHVAFVDFEISMQSMDKDGILDETPYPVKDFIDTGMGNKGRLIVKGGSFVETLKKVDKIMRYINEQD